MKIFTREEGGYGHLVLLMQQAQQVAQSGQFPNGQPINPAMGTAEVPDMGALTAAPNLGQQQAGGAPGNGNLGGTVAAPVPTQSAAPGIGPR